MEQRQDVEAYPVSADVIFAMWFALPLDVIWKHQMGERRLNFWHLILHTIFILFSVFFLTLLAFPSLLVPPPGQNQNGQILAVRGFILLMWACGLANLWEIRRRRKAGIQWHTYYRGKPRFLPNKPVVRYLFIPLGSGLIAYGFYRLFPPMGIYLFAVAAMQLLDAADADSTRESEGLDRRDREIEMEIKTAELEHRYRGPLDIVCMAAPPKRVRSPEKEAAFETRWKNVLKPSDSEKT
jgi:hypothetical protein